MTDALEQEKYKILLEQHSRRYEQQLSQVKDAVNRIATELEAVKKQLESRPAQAPAQNKPVVQQKVLPATDKPTSHPRQGNFTPEDVDIKKMFYFGHK